MGNLFHTQIIPQLPTEYWIGLCTTEPTVSGVVVGEPSPAGTGYSRVKITNLSAPTNGVITSTAAISFPESITNWGTLLYYAVFDAQTDGNLLFYGSLSVSRTVEPGTVVTIRSGELSIKLKNPSS